MQSIRQHSLRLLIALVSFIPGGNILAQSQTDLDKVAIPQILPASPEVTSFMKVGFGTANMSTGAATASIPLYTIKIKDYEFPISVSYSTQGLKADEHSSRVGLGWTLNATGMVSRSVHGIPDEFGSRDSLGRRPVPPASFPDDQNLLNAGLVAFYDRASDPAGSNLDLQVDEFNYHVNGRTGSFVLDNNYQPKLTTANNDLVSVSAGPNGGIGIGIITIITADGVKYTFGTVEKTMSTDIPMYNNAYKASTITAWFLDEIELPNGEKIGFNYTYLEQTVSTGRTQTYIVPEPSTPPTFLSSLGPPISKQDNVSYRTYLLNSITVSNGISVNFTYGSSNLTNLDVPGQKHLEFLYDYNEDGGRSFLTAIIDVTGDRFSYGFEYDRMFDVPNPIVCSQDYLGFCNGDNSKPMIPPNLQYNQYFDPTDYSPPSSDAAKMGTLTKITYPTNGTQEFFYEGNTETDDVTRPDQFERVTLEGQGGGSGGSYLPLVYWKHNIVISFDQSTTLRLWASDAAADFPAETGESVPNVVVWLYDETPGEERLVVNPSATGLNHPNETTPFNLKGGHTYGIKMEAKHYTEISHVEMDYKKYENPITDKLNVTSPGVRVKQIKYTDGIGQSTYSKYYTYATLDRLDITTGSASHPSYTSSAYVMVYPDNPTTGGYLYGRTVYSTSTANQLYSAYHTPVYYRTVIESDDPDLANGGTEYTFYPLDQGSAVDTKKGMGVPVGGGQYPTLTGVVKSQRVFNSKRQVIQTEENEYETSIDLDGMPRSFAARKNFQVKGPDAASPMGFDASEIFYGNYWNRIKKKTTISFDDGLQHKQETQYFYNPLNIQPDSIVINDSKSGIWQTVTRYPNTIASDDPASPGSLLLVFANRMSVPVYKALYHNSIVQQEQRKFYQSWSSGIIEPRQIEVRQSNNDVLHPEIIYTAYDKRGNPRQIRKRNDYYNVFLWDSIQHVPIAEVKNAQLGRVAFTSFENHAYGNWSTSGSLIEDQYFTGTTSFHGSATTKVDTAGTYLVTFWGYGQAPLVSIDDVYQTTTTKATVDNWILCQVEINLTSANTLKVSSSSDGNYIDELRLHPVTAEMTSLTYKSFIGVSSRSDVNQRVSFYEYDANNRLQLIRDQDRNIIKTFDYKYHRQ